MYCSPPNAELCEINLDPDVALYRLNEEKDKEIDRLTQQVKDLKEASSRLQDRMYCIPDDISHEMSMDDDVFLNSAVSSVNEEDRNLDLERFDGGAVMSQTYTGSLGTSPFHRMSVISMSGDEDVGILTENEFTATSPW